MEQLPHQYFGDVMTAMLLSLLKGSHECLSDCYLPEGDDICQMHPTGDLNGHFMQNDFFGFLSDGVHENTIDFPISD